jgi:quercetin dioxygenase-like cupin family protein
MTTSELSKGVHFMPFKNLPAADRGDGIVTKSITTTEQGACNIRTGFTHIRPKGTVPMHTHNCEEQITVLEGRLRTRVGDQTFEAGPKDSYFIYAGVPHGFTNIGDTPVTLMFIYGASYVTRTFMETGETVDHVDNRDLVPPPPLRKRA